MSSRAGHGPSNEAPQYADGILRPAIIPGSARMGGVEAASGSDTVQWSAAENAALVLQMASQQEQDDAGEDSWEAMGEPSAPAAAGQASLPPTEEKEEELDDWEAGLMADGTSLEESSALSSWSEEDVKAYLEENAGKQFDPLITHIMLEHFDKILEIRALEPDEDE